MHIPPDASFIQHLYNTLLNRTGTDAEIAAWQSLKLDIAHVVLGFTESIEYKADTYAFNLVPGSPPPAPTLYDAFLTETGATHQHINVVGTVSTMDHFG